jgi:hypothetical protein
MLRFELRTVVLVGGLALERDPAALARFAASEGFGVVAGTRGFGGGGSRGFAVAVVAALTAVTLWTTAAAWSFPGFFRQ